MTSVVVELTIQAAGEGGRGSLPSNTLATTWIRAAS
jgi:hypothetical protein